jgi:hypothetical protein
MPTYEGSHERDHSLTTIQVEGSESSLYGDASTDGVTYYSCIVLMKAMMGYVSLPFLFYPRVVPTNCLGRVEKGIKPAISPV